MYLDIQKVNTIKISFQDWRKSEDIFIQVKLKKVGYSSAELQRMYFGQQEWITNGMPEAQKTNDKKNRTKGQLYC